MNEKIITLKNLGKFAEWIKDKFENKADRSEIPTTLPADGGNADTVGGKSAEELIQSNPNLLLNPDFKINQRGRTEYSGYTSTVDRWEKTTAGIVTIDSDGVTLNNTGGTAAMYWGQVLSLNLANVPVSLSACDSDGNIYSISGIAPEKSKNPLKLLISDIGSFYVDLNVDHYEFFFQVKAGKSIKIKWAKLEYGHIVTSFIPPNPIEEALKCGSLKNAEQQLFYGNGKWAECPPNPNLLDNPDFKINQRGQSEYTGITYTVDRWRTFDSKSKIQVVNSGIKITTLTAANENENTNPLFQIFDRPVDTYNGKQFTLSLKAINITGPWRVCIRFGKSFPSGDYVTATYRTISSEINHWTFTVPDQAVSMRIGIVQYGPDGSAIGDTITIEWIKLELGAVATPFVPPNGAEELLKCQKYCLTLTTDICRNYTMNTNLLWFLIPTATRLRLSPYASDISKLKVKVYGTGTIYDDFTYQIGVKSYPPAIIVEAQKANHGINTNVGGVLTVPTGMLILSADL